MSAFGALTPGIAVAKLLPGAWSADLKLALYRQRAGWRPGGGSPGLEAFSAPWIRPASPRPSDHFTRCFGHGGIAIVNRWLKERATTR